MNALSKYDTESELSFAYLHAVASRAGVNCSIGNRHSDNAGIDATLTSWGPFTEGGYLTEVNINVQLKATIKSPGTKEKYCSYFLKEARQYDSLRAETHNIPRVLVVLFLPQNEHEWLIHSTTGLSLQQCAYWVSLRGAPDIANKTGLTVYLPRVQVFDPQNLCALMNLLSKRDFPKYEGLNDHD
jgi:hypothetical protein